MGTSGISEAWGQISQRRAPRTEFTVVRRDSNEVKSRGWPAPGRIEFMYNKAGSGVSEYTLRAGSLSQPSVL